MKKLSVAAIIVALLSAGASGFAVWRTYDATATDQGGSGTTTSVPGSVTTRIPLVTVPSEAGKNGFFAALALNRLNLRAEVVRAPSVSIPKDHVISQNPTEGTQVPEGTVIKLTLSSGPP